MSHAHIDVRYVAGLARLELSEEEISLFQGQLDAILGHVSQLSQLDVSGIEPTAHPMVVAAPLRADVVRTSLPVERVARNFPEQSQLQVRVPKVVADA